MQIIVRPHNRRIKQKVEKDLYWYNPDTSEVEHFRGGSLSFKYDRSLGRQVPYVVDDECFVWQNSWDEINSWIKKHNGTLAISEIVPRGYAVIKLNSGLWPKLERELRQQNILYEIENDEDEEEEALGAKSGSAA